jgi:hypothetical protein
MGLKDARRIIEDAVQQQQDRMYSPYIKHIDGNAPSFVTYLRASEEFSTQLMGTNVHYADFGKDSPIKWDRIKNVPLFGFQIADLSSMETVDNIGTEVEITGDCRLMANTYVPKPNEYFIVNYLSKNLLFQITAAKPNILDSNYMYKIEYQLKRVLTDETQKDIDMNVVREYECIYENIGTTMKSVIRSDDYFIREKLIKIYEELLDYFVEWYYEPLTNSFVDDSNGLFIYNKYLTKFIVDNKLFKGTKYNHITLVNEAELERDFINTYKGTIYGALEDKSTRRLTYNTCRLDQSYSRYSTFSNYPYKYNIMCIDESLDEYPELKESVFNTTIIDSKLFDILKNDDVLYEDANILETIIYNFLTKDKYIFSHDNIEDLEDYYIDTETYNMNIMSVILFILKKSIEFYTSYKTNYSLEMSRGGIDNIR